MTTEVYGYDFDGVIHTHMKLELKGKRHPNIDVNEFLDALKNNNFVSFHIFFKKHMNETVIKHMLEHKGDEKYIITANLKFDSNPDSDIKNLFLQYLEKVWDIKKIEEIIYSESEKKYEVIKDKKITTFIDDSCNVLNSINKADLSISNLNNLIWSYPERRQLFTVEDYNEGVSTSNVTVCDNINKLIGTVDLASNIETDLKLKPYFTDIKDTIRVLFYNILDNDKLSGADENDLDKKKRYQNIANYIKVSDPDIFGLAEAENILSSDNKKLADSGDFDMFHNTFSSNYDTIITDNNDSNHKNIIFYKKAKFTKEGTESKDQIIEVNSDKRSIIGVKLKCIGTNFTQWKDNEICVVCVHHPHVTNKNDIKEKFNDLGTKINNILNDISYNNSKDGVIVMGDLNELSKKIHPQFDNKNNISYYKGNISTNWSGNTTKVNEIKDKQYFPDVIGVSKNMFNQEYKVITEKINNKDKNHELSDHRPIMTVLSDIKPKTDFDKYLVDRLKNFSESEDNFDVIESTMNYPDLLNFVKKNNESELKVLNVTKKDEAGDKFVYIELDLTEDDYNDGKKLENGFSNNTRLNSIFKRKSIRKKTSPRTSTTTTATTP